MNCSGSGRPGEHRGRRRRDVPAGPLHGLHQHVAARLVDGADLVDAVLRAVQRRGRRHLDRGVGAVVEVGLHPRQGRADPLVADHHADPPAGHGVGLGQRIDLDGDVLGAVDLQDRGRRVVVEIDLRIGDVGEHQHVVLLRQRDGVLVEVQVDPLGRRVGRIADDQHGRRRRGVRHRPADAGQIVLGRQRRHVADHPAGHDEAVGVDRIGRVRADDHVAGRGQGLGEVGEALLGAQGGDHLGVGVQLHAEAAVVVAGHGAAQADDALGGRIAAGLGVAGGLDQLVDDVLGRRHVGIAHAEVDDVDALGAQARLEAVDLLEDVGRQASDAVEIGGHVQLRRCPRAALGSWGLAHG